MSPKKSNRGPDRALSAVTAPEPAHQTPFGRAEAEAILPGWAIGPTAAKREMSERERKLTAAIYAQLTGVVEHVRRLGTLPEGMKTARGAEFGLRLLVTRRGLDIELTEDERLVADALAASGTVPAGCAALLDARALRRG